MGNHKVDMDVRFKEETPVEATKVYRINDVVVYADYDLLRSDTLNSFENAERYKGYIIVDPENKFKPKIFSRTLIFKPGDIYSREEHNLSLNRLVNLGIYKFVTPHLTS